MGKIIIPDKLNVAFQERSSGYSYYAQDQYEKFLLGFSTYYKADGTLNVETHKGWGSKDIPLQDYDNTAIEGFEVAGSVGRYTGNKVVEINDPRGFRLQIAVANLMVLLDNCVMDHGKFIGKFAWGWDGGRLNLYSEDSDLYLEGRANFKYASSPNIPIKTITLGSKVTLSNGKTAIYWGDWYLGHYSYYSNSFGPENAPELSPGEKLHLFFEERTQTFFTVKSPVFKAVEYQGNWSRETVLDFSDETLTINASRSVREHLLNLKRKDIYQALGLNGGYQRVPARYLGGWDNEWKNSTTGWGYYEQQQLEEVVNKLTRTDFGGKLVQNYWMATFSNEEDRMALGRAHKQQFTWKMMYATPPTFEQWYNDRVPKIREVYKGDWKADGSRKRYLTLEDVPQEIRTAIDEKANMILQGRRR